MTKYRIIGEGYYTGKPVKCSYITWLLIDTKDRILDLIIDNCFKFNSKRFTKDNEEV